MNKYNIVKKLLAMFLLTVLACAWLGATETLTPLPGAEFNRKNRRQFRDVPVSELVEGSPEWVFRQLMIASQNMDFEELRKYQAPAGVRGASKNTPEEMAGLTAVSLDGVLRVGDSKFEGDRCYVYMGFPLSDGKGGWSLSYCYFLKRDGHWIYVYPEEWQRREMLPTSNG